MNKRRNNPFTLTFGRQPNKIIARYEEQDTIISTFTAENPVSQTYLIEGVRGSGKTVLMTSIAKTISDDERWMVINLNPTLDLLTELALRLNEKGKKISNLIRKGFQVSAAGFGIAINGDNETVDIIGMISEQLRQISKKGKRVLITIDEVLPNENMRVFASQFQIFIREDYPLFLLMTGLHENIHAVQNDPALTFLLRSPKLKVSTLSLFQIRRQYRDVLGVDDETAGHLADITKGYAFAFQALGAAYWENSEASDIQGVLEVLDEMLDGFVYRKIWESLTKRDREIIQAMNDDETAVKEIYSKLSMTANTFSRYREKLIGRGIITATRHGYVSPCLPRFCAITSTYHA